MLLTEQELYPKVVLPFEEDRATAARVPSFFTLLAASWFASPLGFFGLDHELYVWNHVLAGGIAATIALCRLVWPRATTPFAYVNMLLGLWIIISPFVFGYADNTPLLTNSIGCGSVILVWSLVSRFNSARLLPTRSLSSDNDAY